MITAREFTAKLAEVTGFEESEFRTVDKYLADAGLRRKSVGRAYVDVSVTEGLRTLLGVMGAPTKARPAQYVRTAAEYRLKNDGIYVRRGSTDDLRSLIGLTEKELKTLRLIEALEIMTGFFAKNASHNYKGGWGARVWIEVEVNGPITVQVSSTDFDAEIVFSGETPGASGDGRRIAIVSSETLAWIGRNTESESNGGE